MKDESRHPVLRKSKNTNEGEEEEARTRASLVNIQIQLQQKEISAVWRRKSIVNKQMPNTTIRNILRTKTGIHSQQTNKNTTKRNIGRTLADIHSQHTNTNKTKRNIHRTEAGIQSQAPDLTLHTISTMPGGEDELKEQVEALTGH